MPSITPYSSLETLVFFQSVARYGTHESALQDISSALKQSQCIREHASFDADKLSIGALKDLLEEYIKTENDRGSPKVNGDSETIQRSPKRRKLSPSTQLRDASSQGGERPVRDLVERLYGQIRGDLLQDIRKDEEAYGNLQNEIEQLEKQVDAESKQRSQSAMLHQSLSQSDAREKTTKNQEDVKNPRPSLPPPPIPTSIGPDLKANSQVAFPTSLPSNNATTKPQLSSTQASPSQKPEDSTAPQSNLVGPPSRSPQSTTVTHQPPIPVPRQMPSPSGQRPNYGAHPTQPLYSQGQAAQQIPTIQQRLSPHRQQNNNQARNIPANYQPQHPYSPYPSYPPPPPQWHPHMPPQQYQQHSPYGPPPYYPQPPIPLPPGRHPQTPQQPSFASYSHSVPVHHVQTQQWRGQQWPIHSASAASTPISRSDNRSSRPAPNSTTPWKRKRQMINSRQATPPALDRAMSPLTDRDDSPLGNSKKMKKIEDRIQPQQPRRRGRPPSMTPSARGPSRSQSIASRASDIPKDKARQTQKIKVSPPSTPLNVPSSDTEQTHRSSNRRGRPRSNTTTSQTEGTRDMARKRKRERGSSLSDSPAQTSQPVVVTSRSLHQLHDTSLVVVSKNFSKTSQLLLNEITSHKLAGIFAKPLSDRDAPGYKELVLRPQDLKSIKAAISKGSRAALAAIDAIEGEGATTPTNTQIAPNSGVGAIGNGFYLAQKTTDLIPPKGIVNSAQLEMELVRMFANAVMFNPLPASQRGLSRSLRLRRYGGDLNTRTNSEKTSTLEESEDGSSSGIDEGGIIADAREMFNDVVTLVHKWRKLEGERLGSSTDQNNTRTGISTYWANEHGKPGSGSPTSNTVDDDTAVGESEATSTPIPASTPGLGTARKRRRVAEH